MSTTDDVFMNIPQYQDVFGSSESYPRRENNHLLTPQASTSNIPDCIITFQLILTTYEILLTVYFIVEDFINIKVVPRNLITGNITSQNLTLPYLEVVAIAEK